MVKIAIHAPNEDHRPRLQDAGVPEIHALSLTAEHNLWWQEERGEKARKSQAASGSMETELCDEVDRAKRRSNAYSLLPWAPLHFTLCTCPHPVLAHNFVQVDPTGLLALAHDACDGNALHTTTEESRSGSEDGPLVSWDRGPGGQKNTLS